MKRLFLSVLMLMVATFIFSQASKEKEDQDFKKDLVQNQQKVQHNIN